MMPETYELLEYYAPSLEGYRGDDLDPGQGSLALGEIKRRIVVCLNEIHPDPCAAFRAEAQKNPAWSRVESLRGFTIYAREK